MAKLPPRLQFPVPVLVGLCSILLLVIGFWLAPVSLDSMTSELIQPARSVHVPMPGPAPQALLPTRPSIAKVDCTKVACLALTFDDGPNPYTTPEILDVLEQNHVPASFFVVGSRVHGQEKLLRRMFYDGDEIGNHSWTHPDLTMLSSVQIMDQVMQTQAAVMRAGVPAPTLFRPPYGAVNATVRSTVPLTLAMWNGDPLDWQEKDVNKVIDSIVGQAKPGGVLDMHDIYGVTAQAIGPAIDQLKTQYTFVTFSQLFDLQPGQRGEFFGR